MSEQPVTCPWCEGKALNRAARRAAGIRHCPLCLGEGVLPEANVPEIDAMLREVRRRTTGRENQAPW